jgi:hypothetical protein
VSAVLVAAHQDRARHRVVGIALDRRRVFADPQTVRGHPGQLREPGPGAASGRVHGDGRSSRSRRRCWPPAATASVLLYEVKPGTRPDPKTIVSASLAVKAIEPGVAYGDYRIRYRRKDPRADPDDQAAKGYIF